MTVLPHLGDKHARTAAFFLRKGFDVVANGSEFVVAFIGAAIDAADGTDFRAVAAKNFFHGVRYFSHSCARAGSFHRQFQQIGIALRTFHDSVERGLGFGFVAFGAHRFQPRDLGVAHGAVVDIAHIDRVFVLQLEFVDADDHVLAAVHARLPPRRRFLDAQLGNAGFDRLGHAAHRFHFIDDRFGMRCQRMRQRLHVIGTTQRIDHMGDLRLVLEDELRVARDAGGELRRQRDGFVQRIGVQRLRAAQHRRQRLDRGAHDVVVGILFGQRHAGCLAMRAQHQRVRLLRAEFVHDLRPQQARGAQLGHFHEEVHADAEEERQARRERVHRQSLRHRGADIFHAIRQRVGQLLHRRRTGFVHVIAADRDRIELRHLFRRVFDDVGDDAHRRRGRIDVGVAHHELFENVVLNGAGEFLRRNALLFARDDEIRQDGNDRAVHRHRHAHLVERDSVEQDFHVLNAVDRHAGFADIARHARMIAVVAAMRRQIEGHRKAHLPRREVLSVEGVGFFGGREARILADGPGPARIHGGAHAAHERHLPRQRVHRRDAFQVGSRVKRLHVEPFGRVPGEIGQRAVLELLLGRFRPDLRILAAHRCSPTKSRAGSIAGAK